MFAFDAAAWWRNIDREVAVGGFIDCAPDETVESIRRLKAVSTERAYSLVPGHDPVVWPTIRKNSPRGGLLPIPTEDCSS